MHCIVGLGNPGVQYQYTRHNIGFMILDALAEKHQVSFKKGAGPYLISEMILGEHELLLVKPMTYMNRSGIAVDDVVKRYALSAAGCLTVFDDIQLPFEKIRLRPGGSDGGHNGLASVINFLRTSNIPRLRIGIGIDPEMDLISYVLGPFSEEQMATLDSVVYRSIQAIESVVNNGLEKTMNKYNS